MSRMLDSNESKAVDAALMKKQQELLDAKKARDILAAITRQLDSSYVHRTVILVKKDKE